MMRFTARMEQTRGCAMDLSAVYVVDENCPRTLLGTGTKRAFFTDKVQRRCTMKAKQLADEGEPSAVSPDQIEDVAKVAAVLKK